MKWFGFVVYGLMSVVLTFVGGCSKKIDEPSERRPPVVQQMSIPKHVEPAEDKKLE